ncbi:uncharacterized protein LOC130690172 [Daphnia carinata]|uniref:uncharacterized protein LOC130690172 n=1 Tax=Daphnia carinata TaxID=120202 RepID=UPI002579CE1A|nr:uncharacterized protein LOC130690172 [Daphnia carinata]
MPEVERGSDSNDEMKLLESFSLVPLALLEYRSNYTETDATSNDDGCSSICRCLVPEMCSHLHQSPGKIWPVATNEKLVSCLHQIPTNNPSVVQTMDVTMELEKNVSSMVSTTLLNTDKTPPQGGKPSKCKLCPRVLYFNTYTHTRSKTKSDIIPVIEPTDCCIHCRQELSMKSMKSAVFCLKTGNVLITCCYCSAIMSIKGALKLPKHI